MVMMSHGEWVERSARLSFPSLAFIDGNHQAAVSGATFECINPATGQKLADVAACDAADVELAVRSARRAFETGAWSRAAPAERKRILVRLAELIEHNRIELALLESLDMGKLVKDAFNLDVPGSAEVFRWYGEAIDKLYDEIAPTDANSLAMITREPLGVVAAVVPWNFPLKMAAWKCAPALAAGNSVVLKPAEQSPLTALRLGELAAEAGLPAGVLNVVPGFGPTAGRALGLHMDVDCAAFTGSTEVGKLFLGYAGQSNMKQIWLECGGKSPNLVMPDCGDLDAAARMAAGAMFFNQGEVCSAPSRLFVHRSAKDEMVERLKTLAEAATPGDPLDPGSPMGALVSEEHTERVMSFIEEGRKTADLVAGGERLTIGAGSCFVQPTVFDSVSNDQRLAREEIFGPVLSVLTFDTEEEAIRMANDSVYGLAASIWTDSLSRAHRIARQLHVGSVSINTVDMVSVATPFGGFKQSGSGRDLSLHALDKYTALKTTWISL